MFLVLLLTLLLLVAASVTAYGLRKGCSRGARALVVLAPIADGILVGAGQDASGDVGRAIPHASCHHEVGV